jgi:catechol 2,3-dioxygenase-like lactoylglutathione lyase family enzyme
MSNPSMYRIDTPGRPTPECAMDRTSFRVVALDHVQLAMPPGSAAEDEANRFYAGVLGLTRVPKPAQLALRGGCWFERGTVKLHLGIEDDFRPARKAHPALVVADLPALLDALGRAGRVTRRTEDVPGRPQWYVDDPFGNRIELIPA